MPTRIGAPLEPIPAKRIERVLQRPAATVTQHAARDFTLVNTVASGERPLRLAKRSEVTRDGGRTYM